MNKITKEDLIKVRHDPEKLEKLYRRNPHMFAHYFQELYTQYPTSTILQVWDVRLRSEEELSKPLSHDQRVSKSPLLLTVFIALAVGLMVKLPVLIPAIDGEWFYPRFVALLIITGMIMYWVGTHALPRKLCKIVCGAMAAIWLFALLVPFPQQSQTFVLTYLYLPIVMISLFGIAYGGEEWNGTSKRLAFLRFLGEVFIFTVLVWLGGSVLAMITFSLFSLIGLQIEPWYSEYIIIMGAVASPIVATFLVDRYAKHTVIASIVSKVFVPLFLVTLLFYLAAMLIEQQSLFHDRNLLIVFNILLLIVLAMSIFSLTEIKHDVSMLLGTMVISLIAVTLIIDSVALSAIIYRLYLYGITPNRLSMLGTNIAIFVHLAGILVMYLRYRDKQHYKTLQAWTARYLPVYTLWSATVAFVFPLMFGFA